MAETALATPQWHGLAAAALETRLGLSRVVVFDAVSSTMDEAHALGAAGAASGTLLLARSQRAGRGRGGKQWASAADGGIWLTLLERPNDPAALDVLSLRVGLRLARVLERFAEAPVRLKWPNDIYLGDGKLAGILVETRWRDGRPEWVAIGVGINLRVAPDVPDAAALDDVSALDLLEDAIPQLRAAAAARGHLAPDEVEAFAARDLARGRRAIAPLAGEVTGVAADGSLLIRGPGGVQRCRSGSLRFEDLDP